MQATMLDIVGMIFQILRGYFPESVLMSPLVDFYDTFAYTLCIFPVLYCIYYALTYVVWGCFGALERERGKTKEEPFTHRPSLKPTRGGRAGTNKPHPPEKDPSCLLGFPDARSFRPFTTGLEKIPKWLFFSSRAPCLFR